MPYPQCGQVFALDSMPLPQLGQLITIGGASMVAYNFKPRFAQAILSGEKTQTIRAFRTARHAAAGDTMQLYCGMRTKHARQLLEVICTRNVSCNMARNRVSVDGVLVEDLDDFARKDGFRNWRELIDFFLDIYELPFSGRLICWKLPDAACHAATPGSRSP